MRAWVLHEWGARPVLEPVKDPEPAPGLAVVEVAACGVGLTTRNCTRGDLGDDPALLPVIPGHELVGTVVAVGAGGDPDLLGALVTPYFYLFCGRCRRCLGGEEPLCERPGGVIGVHHDGGLAEQVALPVRNLLRLPDGLGAAEATVIADAVATPVHVARRAGIAPGSRVAVLGAGGGVGAHMVQVAALAGAAVAGLDVDPRKLAMLEGELGVTAADASDLGRARLPAAWRGGADVIVDLVGSPETAAWALAHLDAGGRLVMLTTFRGVTAQVEPRGLVLREASVLGSRYASRAEVLDAAGLVRGGAVRPVIGARTDLEGAASLLAGIERNEIPGRGAVVISPRDA
jgi:D-arabinose 1-dehydrogenase-like Zn-dependent alcohol dehydrogenase